MRVRITVIGLGVIGGSLCRAFRRVLPEAHLTGIDLPGVVAAAQKADLVDAALVTERLDAGCRQADLVLLATPIRPALALLPQIARCTRREAIISDVCSLKTEISRLSARLFLGENGHFIGGHPMAGSELGGFRHADPFLFENAIYVLAPTPQVPAEKLARLAALIEKIGAKTVVVAPELHDRIAATVSHLPQMLAVALMQYVAGKNRENSLYLRMAAGGFRDMTRIASSPFAIWRDICAGNKQKIIAELDGFTAALQDIRTALLNDAMQVQFEAAARNRLSIPTDTRGFLRPHFDLSVVVEDRPGVIAGIATALAGREINIKDIEVLKVRENEGGTIRLAFVSEATRQAARELLEKQGYTCQEK